MVELSKKWPLILLLLLIFPPSAPAESPTAKPLEIADSSIKPDYLRLSRDSESRPQALQTSIIRYTTSDQTLAVDLVSAVHIGDQSYYKALNEKFATYDVVLYELIAPPGHKEQLKQGPSDHPVSLLQGTLKNFLKLELQTEAVDYNKPNFVHADMSPEEFSSTMEQQGESFGTMLVRLMLQAHAEQQKNPKLGAEADLLLALLQPDKAMAMKRLLAKQFVELDTFSKVLSGPNQTILISKRNDVALSVLQKIRAAGKAKQIAIFYGAAHMSDFEEKFRHGEIPGTKNLKRSDISWLDAWSLQ